MYFPSFLTFSTLPAWAQWRIIATGVGSGNICLLWTVFVEGAMLCAVPVLTERWLVGAQLGSRTAVSERDIGLLACYGRKGHPIKRMTSSQCVWSVICIRDCRSVASARCCPVPCLRQLIRWLLRAMISAGYTVLPSQVFGWLLTVYWLKHPSSVLVTPGISFRRLRGAVDCILAWKIESKS